MIIITFLNTRSITLLDGSQKTVTKKREDMEGEETAGVADEEEINQISEVKVGIDKKRKTYKQDTDFSSQG